MKRFRLGPVECRCYQTSGAFKGFTSGVVPADITLEFIMEFSDSFYCKHKATLRVEYVRDDWRGDDGSVTKYTRGLSVQPEYYQVIPHEITGKQLRFRIHFAGEHAHTVKITAGTADEFRTESMYFYSVEEDLIGFEVFKGCVHNHSKGSDGQTPPEVIPEEMRGAGFDFTALTDHKNYAPSLLAADACKKSGSGLVCFPGEEPEGLMVGAHHILSLGAPEGITEWQHTHKYEKEVKRREADFKELPPHERHAAAEAEAITARIKELGGLSVLCHPYWENADRYRCTPLLNDAIMRRGNFDALEIGNYETGRMALLNAQIRDLYAEIGFDKPLLGCTDWHASQFYYSSVGHDSFGLKWQKADSDYTIIWAHSPSFEDFKEAVLAHRCVAVGGLNDAFPFGSFRMLRYALFLMTHYFDAGHDSLCRKQSKLMTAYRKGDASALNGIKKIEKDLQLFRSNFFPFAK